MSGNVRVCPGFAAVSGLSAGISLVPDAGEKCGSEALGARATGWRARAAVGFSGAAWGSEPRATRAGASTKPVRAADPVKEAGPVGWGPLAPNSGGTGVSEAAVAWVSGWEPTCAVGLAHRADGTS